MIGFVYGELSNNRIRLPFSRLSDRLAYACAPADHDLGSIHGDWQTQVYGHRLRNGDTEFAIQLLAGGRSCLECGQALLQLSASAGGEDELRKLCLSSLVV